MSDIYSHTALKLILKMYLNNICTLLTYIYIVSRLSLCLCVVELRVITVVNQHLLWIYLFSISIQDKLFYHVLLQRNVQCVVCGVHSMQYMGIDSLIEALCIIASKYCNVHVLFCIDIILCIALCYASHFIMYCIMFVSYRIILY